MCAEDTDTPESAFRRFQIAYHSGDEAAVRALILDSNVAEIPWRGSSPEAFVRSAEFCRTEKIFRLDTSQDDETRVLLQSSGCPTPFHAVKVDGSWKIELSPIIERRKTEKDAPRKFLTTVLNPFTGESLETLNFDAFGELFDRNEPGHHSVYLRTDTTLERDTFLGGLPLDVLRMPGSSFSVTKHRRADCQRAQLVVRVWTDYESARS